MNVFTILLSSFFTILIVGLIIGVLVYVIAPRFIIETSHPFLRDDDFTDVYDGSNLEGEHLTIQTKDSYKLSAYLAYNSTQNTLGTVILIHGITKSKELFIPLSKFLTSQGFHTVALDLRAHGKSEGQYTTFGYYEKHDIANLIDILEEMGHVNIGIWGQSLGGATSIQAMAYDKRLKFGIIESTFSEMKNIVHVYFKYYLGFHYKLLSEYITHRAGEIGNFDPDSVVPAEDCKNIDQPVLMVHGKKDRRISIKSGLRNFKNLKSKVKEFIPIENANHVNVWETAGENLYFSRVVQFIKKNTLHNIQD